MISLAPLRGVTVCEFRKLHAEQFGGIDYAVAPFIPLVAGDRILPKLLKDILPENCGRVRTVPQVIGKDPEQLKTMAKAFADLGYNELNLNCGCPWKFVAKKGRGSGLPENEDNFFAMLDAGCEAVPNGFSVKIRLGTKTNDTLLKRAERLAQYPLKELIIHPRTGVQMYEGTVNLDAFAEVLPQLPMPIVYNGDIYTLADYANIVTRFPSITGVMLGRGLITDPALAEQIKAWETGGRGSLPTLPPRDLPRMIAFIDSLYEVYSATLFGPASILGRMKELWGYTHAYFNNGKEILHHVQRSKSLNDYARAVAPLRR